MGKAKTKIRQLEERWDNADRWLKRLVGMITALGTLAGMFMGLFSWGIGRLDGFVDAKIADVSVQVSAVQQNITEQIDVLKSEVKESQTQSTISRTRLELTTLIAHNPTNVIEIEKVARYYFIDLGGDWYMSQVYSDWAREYGGDTTFVTHK